MAKKNKRRSPAQSVATFHGERLNLDKLASGFSSTMYAAIDATLDNARQDADTLARLSSTRLRAMWAAYATRALLTRVPTGNPDGDRIVSETLSRLNYDRDEALRLPRAIEFDYDVERDLAANFVASRASKMTVSDFLTLVRDLYCAAVDKMTANIARGMPAVELLPYVPVDGDLSLVGTMFEQLLAPPAPLPKNSQSDFRLAAAAMLGRAEGNWLEAYTLPASLNVTADDSSTGFQSSLTVSLSQSIITAHLTLQSSNLRDLLDRYPNEKLTDHLELNTKGQHMVMTYLQAACELHAQNRRLEATLADDKTRVALERRVERLQFQLDERDAEIRALRERAPANGTNSDSLREEVSRLRRELDRERLRANHLLRERDDLASKLNARPAEEFSPETNALRAENESLTRALEDLLHRAIEEAAEPAETQGVQDELLDTSALDGTSIIISGGVPVFRQAMEALHPAIRCFDQRVPPDEAVANADMVWIQPANTSHAVSATLLATCRKLNVPFRFFARRGINYSKRQLVDEVTEFIRG